MEKSANLNLPYIAAAQAQKHVTLNEALTMLDALVQMSVASRQLTSPPATPERGERFVVPDHAIGDWANHGNDIAMWDEDAWVFLSPQAGWRAFIEDEAADYLFDDGWRRPAPAVNPVDKIGVNTLADGANKLSVKSDAVLFSHDDVSPGTGGVRHALNKAGASNTASTLYQNNYISRAEIGLAGDDAFRIKVSDDGSDWKTSLVADAATGQLAFPSGLKHISSGLPISNLIQTPGGTGVSTIWRFDAARTGLPRFADIAGVANDTITLTEPRAKEFFTNQSMQGVSYVRIWNSSKSPEESAWIKSGAATSHTDSTDLVVTNAGDISNWQPGDTIRLGEPVGGTITSPNTAAVDISPMMLAHLGVDIEQAGTMVSMTASTDGTSGGWLGHIACSPDASSGSFQSVYTPNDGALTQSATLCGANSLSPISDSHLIYIREMDNGTGAMNVGSVKVIGIYI